jgi:AP endonuclease-1
MSLKRKSEGRETADATQKKPKFDFFAPKPAAIKTGPSFNFVAKGPETTRLTTWNVNGINSLLKDDQKRKVNHPLETFIE